jgi:hypothetical protein
MASVLYNSLANALLGGEIDFATDPIFAALVGPSYAPDRDAHTTIADVTGEAVGAGYVAGGKVVAVTIEQDNLNDRTKVHFASTVWPAATITARGAVLYRPATGALISYVDFGANVSSTNDAFTVNFSTPLIMQM